MKYDYRCIDCKKMFEVEVIGMLKIEKKRPIKATCPNCRSKNTKRVFNPLAVKFHGSAKGGGLE